MTSTPSPQQGIWTLTAPDGRTWQADSPLKAVSAEQRERVPAQRIGDIEHRIDRHAAGVLRSGREMRAAPMARQVGYHKVYPRQMAGERDEAGRIVEPAMQRQHAGTRRRRTAQPGDPPQRDVDLERVQRHARASFAWRTSMASASAWCASSLRQGM